MCCGQDEGPRAAAVTTEEPMAKVYTAVPGAVLSIGGFGIASNEQAAEVPESVAAELDGRDDLVIVRDDFWASTSNKQLNFLQHIVSLLKVSGIWVSPFEVETAVASHPAVLEAAVVPHEDEEGLLKPKAFIVLKEGFGREGIEVRECVRQGAADGGEEGHAALRACLALASNTARANPSGVALRMFLRSGPGATKCIRLPSLGSTRLGGGMTKAGEVHKQVRLVYASLGGDR